MEKNSSGSFNWEFFFFEIFGFFFPDLSICWYFRRVLRNMIFFFNFSDFFNFPDFFDIFGFFFEIFGCFWIFGFFEFFFLDFSSYEWIIFGLFFNFFFGKFSFFFDTHNCQDRNIVEFAKVGSFCLYQIQILRIIAEVVLWRRFL